MSDLNQLGKEALEWQNRNFPDMIDERWGKIRTVVVAAEEVGEVARAVTKQFDQIRGSYEFWNAEIGKECADSIISLTILAARAGVDLEVVLAERWANVRNRDWIKDPMRGGQ